MIEDELNAIGAGLKIKRILEKLSDWERQIAMEEASRGFCPRCWCNLTEDRPICHCWNDE
jgi:hypothetical protein